MPTRYSQSVTAFAAVGSLAYGYASSIIAYTIGFQSFFDYMGLVSNSDHSNSIIGAANGLYVNYIQSCKFIREVLTVSFKQIAWRRVLGLSLHCLVWRSLRAKEEHANWLCYRYRWG